MKKVKMDGFNEPEQRFNHKSRLNYPTFCLKDCKNRDVKCDQCFKYQGKETEYEPKNL
jgi:hypothetical protein